MTSPAPMHTQLGQWWSGVTLRNKITGVTVFLLTLGLLVAGIGTSTVLRNYLIGEIDAKIQTTALDLRAQENSIAGNCDWLGSRSSYYVAMLTTGGGTLCSNRGAQQLQPVLSGLDAQLVPQLLQRQGVLVTASDESRSAQWRILATAYTDTRTDSTVILAVGLNLAETNGIIATYSAIFFAFGLAVLVLGAALTRLLVTSTFAPLREVEVTAAAIADGDFSQRLPAVTPNTEVGRLNRSLNTMLNRIDRALADRGRTIELMRRFIGDASHELRTPLVSVRGYAELYRMGALTTPEEVAQAMERIEKEAVRMTELVEDLLELARLDEARPLQLAPLDLLPLAKDAALDAMAIDPERVVTVIVRDTPEEAAVSEPAGDTKAAGRPERRGTSAATAAALSKLRGRRSRTEAPAAAPAVVQFAEDVPTTVLAEENKIRQVIANLMGNAMRFTKAGSPLELALHADVRAGQVTLEVIDHGEGIPSQIRDKIFQRLWRADTSRARETGGSGLGLAIVSGIVAAHKGAVDVIETPGGGATFRVTLPLLPSAIPTAPLPHQDAASAKAAATRLASPQRGRQTRAERKR